jgi:alkylated DNA repair dioxygenase AlkB
MVIACAALFHAIRKRDGEPLDPAMGEDAGRSHQAGVPRQVERGGQFFLKTPVHPTGGEVAVSALDQPGSGREFDEAKLPVPGLRYYAAYLPGTEQQDLLAIIDRQPWIAELRRRVQHYGYRYDYRRHAIDRSMYLGPLPDWAARLAGRLYRDGLAPYVPDQVIVNEYRPGQGIASHVDCVPCFGDTILSLSLGSVCVMEFTRLRSAEKLALPLEPGSLLALRGEARYRWKHGIPARKADLYRGRAIERRRRVSLTFRTVIPA